MNAAALVHNVIRENIILKIGYAMELQIASRICGGGSRVGGLELG
jgi:hypothetical protein